MKKRKWVLPVGIVGGLVALCILLLIAALCMMGIKGYGINLSDGYARCEKGQAEQTEQAEVDDLLYKEWEFRDDFLEKGSYTLYKDMLELQVPEPEKILLLCNGELLEMITYADTDIVIEIPKDGNYQLIAIDEAGNQTDVTMATAKEVKHADDSPILFLK